ncbi:MAG: thioredoxin 1 [Bacteroidia bacterium]|jgi:thioredoxin 1
MQFNKKIIKSTLITTLVLVAIGCGTSSKSVGQNAPSEVLGATAFNAQIKATVKPQIVDVRTSEEYNSGYIKDAMNLDFYASDFDQKLGLLNKNDTVFVYCKSGRRSADATSKLVAMGFTKVYDLSGGITTWRAVNLPLAGDEKPTTTSGMSVADFDMLSSSETLVLIDFYAPWCGPCKQMAPYLAEMKKKYPENKLKIVKIDVDQNSVISNHFKIEGIPHIKVFKDGKEVYTHTGMLREEQMMDVLKPYL